MHVGYPNFRRHDRHLSLGRRIAVRTLAAFVLTFAVLRAVTAIIHFDLFPHGPFRNLVTKSGLHIHHLFWGILLLMMTGFGALATRDEGWHLRLAVLFGVALALTLDEFALWLRLADVYWSPEGVESLKAAAVATALLAAYGFGQPFWHGVAKDLIKRRAARRLFGKTSNPRRRSSQPMFTSPALSMIESSNPALGTRRVSKPCAVPTNLTTDEGSRRLISLATAMPG